MKTRMCEECIYFAWVGHCESKAEGICTKKHKLRFYKLTERQILNGSQEWGYKRKCTDYKSNSR